MDGVLEMLRLGANGVVALLKVALLVVGVAVVRPVSASAGAAVCATSLLWLLASLVSTVFFMVAPGLDIDFDVGVVTAVTLVSSFIYAVGLGLLIYAVVALANRS
ncbi:MAG: hypothetical protein AAFP04_00390 [Myxococcota bacterium]